MINITTIILLNVLVYINIFCSWLNENINILSIIIAFVSLVIAFVSAWFAKKSLNQTREFYIDERLDELYNLTSHCYNDALNLKNDIDLLKNGQYDFLTTQDNYNKEQREFLSLLNKMEFFSINHNLGYLHFLCSQNFDKTCFTASSSIFQNKSNLFNKLNESDIEISQQLRDNFIFFSMFAEIENKYSIKFRETIIKKLEGARKKQKTSIYNQKKIINKLENFIDAFKKTNDFIISINSLLKEKTKKLPFLYNLFDKYSNEIIYCIENEHSNNINEKICCVIKKIKDDSKKDPYFNLLTELKKEYNDFLRIEVNSMSQNNSKKRVRINESLSRNRKTVTKSPSTPKPKPKTK